jgi:DNA polymerase kappa
MFHNHKSGVRCANREQIAKVIEETSKGSQFYQHEQRSLQRILEKAQDLRQQLESLTEYELKKASKELEGRLEASRSVVFAKETQRFYVHFDMDAFYAAVETLNRPELANVPMAVGGERANSILCTANYQARAFGVTSAMPVFIAKKLCPQLVVLPVDFSKYQHYGTIIRKIFVRYDATFRSYSLDEGNLDLTEHLLSFGSTAAQTVAEIKQAIWNETGLTCSAGIACSRLLAKICSNVNKPNGIFELEFGVQATEAFLADLPIRKLNGIGKVSERLLFELFGIKTCKDIWKWQNEIYLLFGSAFWVQLARGCSTEDYQKVSERKRKSISYQRSFSPTSCQAFQLQALENAVKNVVSEMNSLQVEGKTISLRYKRPNFEYITRSTTLASATSETGIIMQSVRELLLAEKPQPLTVRLIGVAVSNLQTEQKNANGIEKVRLGVFIG